MDNKKESIDKKNNELKSSDYDYYDIKNIASVSDYTGTIPTPPLTDEEVEGYSDIYFVPQQKAENAKKADSPKQQELRSSTKGNTK